MKPSPEQKSIILDQFYQQYFIAGQQIASIGFDDATLVVHLYPNTELLLPETFNGVDVRVEHNGRHARILPARVVMDD